MKYIVKFNDRRGVYLTETWDDYHLMVINTLSELITIKIGIMPSITVVEDYTIILKLDSREYNKYKITMPLYNQYDITQIDWLYITVDDRQGTYDTVDFDGFYMEEVIEWFPEWHKADILEDYEYDCYN